MDQVLQVGERQRSIVIQAAQGCDQQCEKVLVAGRRPAELLSKVQRFAVVTQCKVRLTNQLQRTVGTRGLMCQNGFMFTRRG